MSRKSTGSDPDTKYTWSGSD